MPRAKLIVNPVAGRGLAARSVEPVRRALAAAGVPFELERTDAPERAIDAAQRARREGFDVVVAVGGDGTVHEVVNGLVRAAAPGGVAGPLAVLPVGSGNDFAFACGVERGPAALVRALRAPRKKRIDLGAVRLRGADGALSRVFDNTLGVGFEARVTRESQRIRWLRGPALYLLALARALAQLQAAPFRLRWEGQAGGVQELSQDLLMLTAGNGPRSGGGFFLTPQSVNDDGWLELGTVERLSRGQLLRLLPRVMRGRHIGHRAVHTERCRWFELDSSVPFPVHADGELLDEGVRALRVELQPARLELLL